VSAGLTLQVRTPEGLLVDQAVRSIVVEDQDGWFGIRPGRIDVVASIPPGLTIFRDESGEHFIASSGGLLDLRDDLCRIMLRDAEVCDELAEASDRLAEARQRRRERSETYRGVFEELEREALRRFAQRTREEAQ
jgi:F-type H+-transporting ATPase subunit epsilon